MDTSRAIRTHRDRVALVEAVRAAGPSQNETTCLEWKSRLELAEKRAHLEIARQVLGFANRDPNLAAAAGFEGCAYVLVGVSPGDLQGVEPRDPADLVPWLESYIGTDGPRCDLDFVQVDGRAVLVVTVEAPAWGDAIHTLRKDFEKYQAGDIFVRHPGRTERARPADVSMLTARARASDPTMELDVGVRHGSPVHALSIHPGLGDVWADEETKRLLGLLPETGLAAYMATGGMLLDRRSPAEYREEVRRYAGKLRAEYPTRVKFAAVEAAIAGLTLEIRNRTERNFADVRIEMSFPPGIEAYEEAEDVRPTGFTKAPADWGTRTFALDIAALREIRPFPRVVSLLSISNADGAHVTFPSMHLRPRRSEGLPTVHLVVDEGLRGQTVEGRWEATSTSIGGVTAGNVVFDVAPEPVPAHRVLDQLKEAPW